jgi:tetratricopeptide (TPR) repeat protein
LTLFKSAIDKDPNYAEAHSAMATAYGELGTAGWLPYSEAFTNQRNEALKAIEIDDALAEGHVELANALLDQKWDWAGAQKELTRAIELSPNSAFAHRSYSLLLCRAGKLPQALAEANLDMKLDPVSRLSLMNIAAINYYGRQYDQALAFLQTLQSADPNPSGFGLGFFFGTVYVEKDLYRQAIPEFERLGDKPHALGHLGNAYARSGRLAEAREIIPKLLDHVAREGIGRYEIALVYAGLGEKDEAFAWLEKAYDAHDKGMTYLKIDPCLDPLRSDYRFQDLLQRMRFPS